MAATHVSHKDQGDHRLFSRHLKETHNLVPRSYDPGFVWACLQNAKWGFHFDVLLVPCVIELAMGP